MKEQRPIFPEQTKVSNETQDPRYSIKEQFPLFSENLPFTVQNPEIKQSFEQSYISFQEGINPSISKFARHPQNPEKTSEISKQLNQTANQIILKTVESLGYQNSTMVEISKADIFTIDSTLGMLVRHINQQAEQGKSFSEAQKDLLLAFNPSLNQKEYRAYMDDFTNQILKTPAHRIKNSPKQMLVLSTLPESELTPIINQLIQTASQDSKQTLLLIADNLPSSNKSLVGSLLLKELNTSPENQFARESFQIIANLQNNRVEEYATQVQQDLQKIRKKFDFGRGWERITQNRLILSVGYIWSTITFLSNTIAAGSLMLSKDRAKHKDAIARNLAIAGVSAGIMGATGMSLLTGKPPLEIAVNYINKAFNFLTMNKEDIDNQSVNNAKLTIPKLLDRSGPYISAIFTDDQIIESIVSTESVIKGDEKLTPETANQKLESLYTEIKARNPKKAEFFKENYILPSQSNPEQAILFVYYIQKSYLKEGVDITTRNSFMATLNQDPDKYPAIDDFDVLNS